MGREGIRFLVLSPLMSIANGLLCFLATRSVFVEHRPRDGKNGDSQTVVARQGTLTLLDGSRNSRHAAPEPELNPDDEQACRYLHSLSSFRMLLPLTTRSMSR